MDVKVFFPSIKKKSFSYGILANNNCNSFSEACFPFFQNHSQHPAAALSAPPTFLLELYLHSGRGILYFILTIALKCKNPKLDKVQYNTRSGGFTHPWCGKSGLCKHIKGLGGDFLPKHLKFYVQKGKGTQKH